MVPGQYGCALTSAEPTGQILIPVAEISQNEFDAIRNALLAGQVIEATLTSEGMSRLYNHINMHRAAVPRSRAQNSDLYN